jgi:hypothetical protein
MTGPCDYRLAVGSGCVDFVLPPEKIARELARISGHPNFNGSQAHTQGTLFTTPRRSKAGFDLLRAWVLDLGI